MTQADYDQLNHWLPSQGWERIEFDGGQSHLMGWTVRSVWVRDKAKITLHHSERYNEVTFEAEANPLGLVWLREQGWGHIFEY
ncbi:hypothetical protein THIAE_10195 [Thiomicrospira aerophila AL3]|uniref:Uncharacterized protein n=1 Tax=Thiomicrospira aerophila AL3 TaxID=717772 RepID=W0DU14_9GAMM|nr:hypothetical protein [Thiomicrospira aerophila]AHF02080.1 hypothetical protein THIAE_10195 [Thiomicrospira aerophila AL3]